MVASFLKYAPVVSLMRSGGDHSATLPTAADSRVTALLRDGTEPWPAGPRAMSSTKRGSFSVVPMFDCATLPPVRTTPPPSARQYSALIASRWLSAMNCAPTSGAPSSPDSASRITSRSSGTLVRFSVSISISAGDEVVLVVHGAAAVHVAAVAHGAERRVRPLRGVDGHHVGVAHDQDGPLLAVALDARDDVRAAPDPWRTPGRECLPCRTPASGNRPRASRCPAGCWCRAAAAPGSAGAFRPRSPRRWSEPEW